MSKQKRPEIGTVMWDVHENLYYDKTVSVAPLTEYVVTSAPITDYFEGGYVEMKMCGPVPHGDRSFPTPRFHKLSDVGKKIVFYTAREAALFAKELTEKYERTWGWCLKQPLRRTWEKYLEER
jgi:hypothetical protein